MTTQRQALAAARKRWGKRAIVRENRHALTPSQRAERIAQVKEMNEHLSRLDAEKKALARPWTELLTAVEFFLAVNGDEPSSTQLREAAALRRQLVDLDDEYKALTAERDRLRSGCHSFRWDAGYIGTMGGLGDYIGIHEHADTLDELVRKIRGDKIATVSGTVSE